MTIAAAAARITFNGYERVVQPPCTSSRGSWYCDPHGGMQNNIAASRHIGDPKCRLVWVCAEHGPEVPE